MIELKINYTGFDEAGHKQINLETYTLSNLFDRLFYAAKHRTNSYLLTVQVYDLSNDYYVGDDDVVISNEHKLLRASIFTDIQIFNALTNDRKNEYMLTFLVEGLQKMCLHPNFLSLPFTFSAEDIIKIERQIRADDYQNIFRSRIIKSPNKQLSASILAEISPDFCQYSLLIKKKGKQDIKVKLTQLVPHQAFSGNFFSKKERKWLNDELFLLWTESHICGFNIDAEKEEFDLIIQLDMRDSLILAVHELVGFMPNFANEDRAKIMQSRFTDAELIDIVYRYMPETLQRIFIKNKNTGEVIEQNRLR
jgi:hypothetical protein